MVMNRKFVVILVQSFLLLCFWPGVVKGQQPLQEQLIGKTTLSEIMAVVDQYYKDHPEEKNTDGEESEYLQWKRWEWYLSGRLGHGSSFVNIPEMLMRGLKEKEENGSSTRKKY